MLYLQYSQNLVEEKNIFLVIQTMQLCLKPSTNAVYYVFTPLAIFMNHVQQYILYACKNLKHGIERKSFFL